MMSVDLYRMVYMVTLFMKIIPVIVRTYLLGIFVIKYQWLRLCEIVIISLKSSKIVNFGYFDGVS